MSLSKHVLRGLHWPWRYARLAMSKRRAVSESELDSARVSILLPTWNRRIYLERSLPSLFRALQGQCVELLIWDNASSDGTGEFLSQLNPPASITLQIEKHPTNIGINALAALARQASGDYLLQLDDDVIGFEPGFLQKMLRAYLSLPALGYLGCGVVTDNYTCGGRPPLWRSIRVRHAPDCDIAYGAVGGWCTLTDRELYDSLGGFTERPGETYFWADLAYRRAVLRSGRKTGILLSTEVYHAFRLALDQASYEAYLSNARARDPHQSQPSLKLADEAFWKNYNRRFGTR